MILRDLKNETKTNQTKKHRRTFEGKGGCWPHLGGQPVPNLTQSRNSYRPRNQRTKKELGKNRGGWVQMGQQRAGSSGCHTGEQQEVRPGSFIRLDGGRGKQQQALSPPALHHASQLTQNQAFLPHKENRRLCITPQTAKSSKDDFREIPTSTVGEGFLHISHL